MAPALASKTLEGLGVPPVVCTLMPSISPLTALPLISITIAPVPWPVGVLQSRAVCPRLVWLLWELGQLGVHLSAFPLPQPLSPGLLWVLAVLLPCPTLVRAAINLPICCPNSVVPSPELVATAALALTFFLDLIFAFHLMGGNHQLQIRSPGGAVEIPDGVSNMLVDPVKEAVFEVLVDL